LLILVDLADGVWSFFLGVSSSLLGAWVFDTTGVVWLSVSGVVGPMAGFDTFFRMAC
jgi:hypothetical protein